MSNLTDLTPRQIVAELDRYIVGQAAAKRNVAIALRNRWRRMKTAEDLRAEITPANILMIGPTGVGKTEVARRLAKIAGAPFAKVEASKFTEVGYVGRDVESMVRDLVEQAVQLIRAEKREDVKERAEEAVRERILDILIPPVKKTAGATTNGVSPDDETLNERTRESFREKIAKGELDERKIDVQLQQKSNPGIAAMGMPGMDESSMIQLQDMLSGMMPSGKPRTRKLTIAEARKMLLEEEVQKLIDMDEVKEQALDRAANQGIIFIDEIDKVVARSEGAGGKGPDVSREGVQRDMLPIIEGSSVNTKYGMIQTDHILFICAGAFHLAKPSDLIPELQGRLPIRVELEALTQDDFVRILTEPKGALTKQYRALFAAEKVEISFSPDAVKAIAEVAFEVNESVENIGARRLHTVMSHLLSDFLFDVPDEIGPNAKLVVTPELVKERLSALSAQKSLSEYIL